MAFIPKKHKVSVSYKVSPLVRDRIVEFTNFINKKAQSNESQSDILETLISAAISSNFEIYKIDGVSYTIRDLFIEEVKSKVEEIKKNAMNFLEVDELIEVGSALNKALIECGYTSGDEYLLSLEYWTGEKYFDNLIEEIKREKEKLVNKNS